MFWVSEKLKKEFHLYEDPLIWWTIFSSNTDSKLILGEIDHKVFIDEKWKTNKVMAFKVYIASHFLAKFEWPFVENWKWKLSPQLHFWRNVVSRFKNVLNSTSNDLLLKNVKESYPPFPFHLHFWGNSASQVLKCKLCASSKKKNGFEDEWRSLLPKTLQKKE